MVKPPYRNEPPCIDRHVPCTKIFSSNFCEANQTSTLHPLPHMSGTLISSLVWVPRGRAAVRPKKYALDEEELERVGKLGGPGVLEHLREEMAGIDVGREDWAE